MHEQQTYPWLDEPPFTTGGRIVTLAVRPPTPAEEANLRTAWEAKAEREGLMNSTTPNKAYDPLEQVQASTPTCADQFTEALDLLSERIRRAEITIGEPQPDTAPGTAVSPPHPANRSIFSEVERMEGHLLRLQYLSARVLDIGQSLERILWAL